MHGEDTPYMCDLECWSKRVIQEEILQNPHLTHLYPHHSSIWNYATIFLDIGLPVDVSIQPGQKFSKMIDRKLRNGSLCRGSRMLAVLLLGPIGLSMGAAAQKPHTTWHDYLGGPDSSHYSALKQINTGNVKNLDVAWSYSTGDDTSYTFSPVVVDNVAYIAAKGGALVAVDAA